jgi:DNA-binding LacI/PurR family transcriptional regulator
MNMKELAKLCGLSVGAVSKAFHNHPSIPTGTRERVLQIAANIGYAPNPELSRFMQSVAHSRHKHEKPIVGVVFPWSREQDLTNEAKDPTINSIWRGLQASSRTMGYRLDPFWLGDPEMTGKRLMSILSARGLEAIILFSCPGAYDKADIDLSRLSCVAIGRILLNRPPITIEIDSFEASGLAMRNAMAMGYKVPGCILMDRNIEQDDGRLQSCLNYFQRRYFAKSRNVPNLIMTTQHDKPWSLPDSRQIRSLGTWIRTQKPDVIFSPYNEVRTWIETAGFAIPSQIGFISLNNPEIGGNAGISYDWEYMGKKAMVLLDNLLAKHSRGAPNYSEFYSIGPQWVEGSSIAQQQSVRRPNAKGGVSPKRSPRGGIS